MSTTKEKSQTAVDDLKRTVAELSPDELTSFSTWFDLYRHEHESDDWDRQMAADAEAGKLDKLIREAEEDIAAGRTHPLP